jgi:hypothetical protein
MGFRMTILLCILVFIISFWPSEVSGGLTTREYDMIKAAFINGYARALRLDMEEIESLVQDGEKMKEFVLSEADKYMQEVLSLNK